MAYWYAFQRPTRSPKSNRLPTLSLCTAAWSGLVTPVYGPRPTNTDCPVLKVERPCCDAEDGAHSTGKLWSASSALQTICWQGLFWCCHEELVGSAHVSGLFARREHRWPSCYPQDQLPIKSTRSRRSGMNGFCRSPVVDRLLHDLTCRPFQLHEARPDGPAYCYAACVTGSRYSPPRVISTQAIRAILLAMATAAILLLRRCNSLSNQGRFVP